LLYLLRKMTAAFGLKNGFFWMWTVHLNKTLLI